MADSLLPPRFEALEEIARSDAEILWRARDLLLQREVVISRPTRELGAIQDPADVERSLRQARALARIQHAGIVRLLDVIETSDGPLLVMEPVPGETLADLLAREGKLSPARVAALALELCRGLEAVHAAGVVHRGVSASNIALRADGSPVLTGFVFAKFGAGEARVPGTTFVYATRDAGAEGPLAPPHPAPEQILGQAADARSDVFGLGWVLYECLTGSSPYPVEIECTAWKEPADPKPASKGLADVVLRCLNPKPLKRYATAKEVRAAIEAVPAPAASRRRRLVALPALAALALVAGLAWAWRSELRGGEALARGTAPKGLGPPGARPEHGYSDRYDRSRALLIGIGETYARNGFPALPNAERDVEAIAARLREIRSENERWDVDVLRGSSASRDEILARLAALSRAAKENDKLFVYYAGHGSRHEVSDKSGWIIPADGQTLEKDPGRRTWVRFDEFAHLFDESLAKHVLVAMDCCYGGRLAVARGAGAAAYGRRLVSEPAKVVITSGRPNEQVSDGVRGENSPFARAFLDALSRTDVEAITSTEIFAGVQARFLEEEVAHLPQRGTPLGSPAGGEVVFFLR